MKEYPVMEAITSGVIPI